MTTAEYNLCVDQHADSVYRFILKNLRDSEKSRDVVQEAFTRMWEKVDTISFEKSRSYLFTSAYHLMIDTIRKDQRSVSMYDVRRSPEAPDRQWTDLKEILDEAVTRLPETQRSALLLRDYEGYSYKEIGDILALNESQVKVYIYRARMAMKDYLVSADLIV
ncbi:MAG TPA: RNA polymerase sigma factor [Bacteroidales bacterium]|nr:RNA polymerase sigma factor [Bacteroidales bacterium]HRZ48030.1 RNA polymerase sigma factor [Bacteroidales bacterium]